MFSPTLVRFRNLRSVGLLGIAIAVASTGLAKELRNSAREQLLRVQVPFVPNAGLSAPEVAFSATTLAGTTFITQDGTIVYSLRPNAAGVSGWALTETAIGASALQPVGSESSGTKVSFFLGNDPGRWRLNLETYRTVVIGKPWPGITLALRTNGNSAEKIFTVEPGANASGIRMRVGGATALRINRDGDLLLSTGLGVISLTAPIAYQDDDGSRRSVSVRYRVEGLSYGFDLMNHDPRLPVVIDPLLQATYLGGSGPDVSGSIALHPISGDVYVSGGTNSTNFPGTAGGIQPANRAPSDVFVARLNASLTALAQATYLGGSGNEVGTAVVIHPSSGDVYVAGGTDSADFPGTIGGAQPGNAGQGDLFVARLNSGLTGLSQSTYLGGAGDEGASGMAVHPNSGEVYLTGKTSFSDFPGTAGGAQPVGGSPFPVDAFVARLNPSLTSLSQATYFGGSDVEQGPAIAIHPTSGDVYISAPTVSTDLPGTAGGAQPLSGGGVQDGFVARINSALTTLLQATYLGSDGNDEALALALNSFSGDVYVAGNTTSVDFPRTAGGAQPASAGGRDVFVARFDSTLTMLSQSSYLSGSSIEFGRSVAVNPGNGEVYVAGITISSDFPGTTGGAQSTRGGLSDAFLVRLNPALTALLRATYLGGSGLDEVRAIAIRSITQEIYATGFTESTNFPGTSGGAQSTSGGATDGFVVRLSADLADFLPSVSVPTLSSGLLLLLGASLGAVALLLLRRAT